jgi:hypothetical protein
MLIFWVFWFLGSGTDNGDYKQCLKNELKKKLLYRLKEIASSFWNWEVVDEKEFGLHLLKF